MLDSTDGKISSNAEPTRDNQSLGSQLLGILEQRRSVMPRRLAEPGPNPLELERLLTVATRVPDHGALEPWRIVVVQGAARESLIKRLSAAFVEAEVQPQSEAAQLGLRKIKATFTAPLVVVVLSCVDGSARIPEWEQLLSAGAVCMNLIAAAAALGYASTWLTGWAAYDPAAVTLLGAQPGERIAGIIPIGTPMELPTERSRPSLDHVVTEWTAA
jgi:nitroreductase